MLYCAWLFENALFPKTDVTEYHMYLSLQIFFFNVNMLPSELFDEVVSFRVRKKLLLVPSFFF